MNKGPRSLIVHSKQLFDIVMYFKNRHPYKVSRGEIEQAFNLPKRTCQRTLQTYVLSGWIKGDRAKPQGFRLSLQACQLLSVDPSKDPLQGLSSTTKAPRKVAEKYQGIII